MQVSKRLESLDGIRGLAALAVVVFHLCLIFPSGWAHYSGNPVPVTASPFRAELFFLLLRTPFAVVAAGRPAVFIFFVLSGFVLAASLSHKHEHYLAYLVRRVTRIWLPFAVAVLMSALLYFLARTDQPVGVSVWFVETSWTSRPTFTTLVQHLSLTGRREDLLNVAWSLVVELQISIIFPLLLLSVRRWAIVPLVSYILLSVACIIVRSRVEHWLVDAFAQTFQYAFLFVAGILLQLADVRRITQRIPRLALAFAWIVALNLLLFRMYTPTLEGRWIWLFGDLFVAAGAVLAIALALRESGQRSVFVNRFSAYAGRVSYSLYLVHLPIILATVHVGSASASLPQLAALALALSLVAAPAFHHLVEVPCQQIGRMLANKLGTVLDSRNAKRPRPAEVPDGTCRNSC